MAKPAWCGGEDDDPDEGCKAVFTQIDVPGAAQTVGILFEFGPGLGTAAIGINNSGSVVGMYATHGQYSNGFRLSHGVFSDVSDPLAGHSPGEGSKCFAINGNGAMACDYITNGITHGFLVDEGKRIPIEAPNQAFFGTQITGVNSSEVVVGVFGSPIGLQGLVWIAGHYSTLGFPAKPYNELHSINDRGDITGAYANNPDGSDGHGFVAFPKER